MPGISFVYTRNHNVNRQTQRILAALDSLLHFPSYHREILLSTSSYLLACTKYKEYPICSFETEDFYFCVEGQIYGKNQSAIRAELKDVAVLFFEDPLDSKGRLKKWLSETSGEFILFFVKKDSNELGILTDALGHLPLYYCKLDGLCLVSREMRFISRLLDNFKIDKAALTQYLLFCYPLGQRSLLEDVSRLGANGFLKINLNSGKIRFGKVFELNFEHKLHANRTAQSNAKHLTEILIEECKAVTRSCENSVNVLALSGGLDSRIVMLGMRHAAVPFYAATRHDSGNASARDVDVAGQLAKLYQLDWHLFELQPPTFRHALKLLHMKNGLNYLGMSFILSFLEGVRKYYGHNVIYWTGDTGLVVRRELPGEDLRTYDILVDRILRGHQIFDPRDIAGLLQTDLKTVREDIKNVLEAYPEQSLGQKFVHFVMHGRTMNWHYEGMDRNRCYFWMSAPLEFTTFFNYAMNCPDSQKTNYRLYRAMLGQMSPASAGIVYAQYRLAPASLLFPILLRAQSTFVKMPQNVKSHFKSLLRQNGHGVPASSLLTECIKQQIDNSPILQEYFSNKYARSLLQRSNAIQTKILLTLTSAIEDLTTSNSSLEEYRGREFS
jgi:asparagine synthase (glutamine-hydrolysing)